MTYLDRDAFATSRSLRMDNTVIFEVLNTIRALLAFVRGDERIRGRIVDSVSCGAKVHDFFWVSLDSFRASVSDTERSSFIHASTMDAWYDALREPFSMSVTEARHLYNKLEYTLFDVYDKQDPDEFLQKAVVYGQEVREATTEQAQAQAAYNKLSAVFQWYDVGIKSPYRDCKILFDLLSAKIGYLAYLLGPELDYRNLTFMAIEN
ncbi:uncharacterized protein N7482_004347 [Penicillium canariense]|uniref:Uncharacterized protein n=1 Tax=Penicillium canariense TaxID=189055 RepID=A0A9W9I8I2_9EURO|nr:uncharacterized protein N7482_004347 [Penicillium canariense]KAJ5168753.1 hypothetical protein N7482_004347 [Penicillium canariense]